MPWVTWGDNLYVSTLLLGERRNAEESLLSGPLISRRPLPGDMTKETFVDLDGLHLSADRWQSWCSARELMAIDWRELVDSPVVVTSRSRDLEQAVQQVRTYARRTEHAPPLRLLYTETDGDEETDGVVTSVRLPLSVVVPELAQATLWMAQAAGTDLDSVRAIYIYE